ncbi:MAG: hypothetical protein CL933_19265 [Deltaproteobacteria bacterium]|nr:hypothetical protein [Deltaproteobacteria bacterium]
MPDLTNADLLAVLDVGSALACGVIDVSGIEAREQTEDEIQHMTRMRAGAAPDRFLFWKGIILSRKRFDEAQPLL